jgi:hypothetical protein
MAGNINIVSMRGQQSLFSNLLTPEVTKTTYTKRGRNDVFITNRDDRMIFRYYYYAKILQLQYPIILANLSAEFDLSELRIIVILNDKHKQLKEVFTQQPTPKELKLKYTWLDWSV